MLLNRLSLAISRIGLLCAAALFTLGYGEPVGNYASHTQTGNQIEFSTGGTQKVRIYVCTPSIARVSFDARGTFASTKDVLSMADVNRTWPEVSGLTVTDATPGTSGTVEIKTSAMIIKVAKSPFRITYCKADGTTITGDAAAMNSNGSSQSNPTFSLTQGASEHYYGWGLAFEQFRSGYHKVDNKGST
jgi:hypothetical protein